MKFSFTQMNEADAREVLAWRYEAPYDFYNAQTSELDKDLSVLTDQQNKYFALRDDEANFLAYYCFGSEAQVDGGDYGENAVDIGGGVRPDMTGSGFGSTFVKVGIDFGTILFGPNVFRATIAAFNSRALKMCEKAGFEPVQRFQGANDMEFVVLLKRD